MIRLKIQKKNFKRAILLLSLFTFVIVMAMMFIKADAEKPSFQIKLDTEEESSESTAEEEGAPVLTVLKEINTEAETVTLLDTENGQNLILNYSGGTNISDKYDQAISVNQLSVGEMLDAYYDKNTFDLTKLQRSVSSWKYQNISKWSMDAQDKIIKIANSKYKYTDDLVITGMGKFLDISDLSKKDELVMEGCGSTIWSVIVSKSHGTLRLEDYDDFLGGTIYIGNKEVLLIVSDMVVTVQEGTYNVFLEKDSIKGNNTVEIKPLKETVLNMSEFKIPKTGLVSFDIKPEGAVLNIDGAPKEYDKPIQVEYGEHAVEITLGGYTTYTGKFDLEEPNKTFSIYMVETGKTNGTDGSTKETGSADTSIVGNADAVNNTKNEDNRTGIKDNNSNENKGTKTEDYEEVETKNNINIETPEDASVYFDGEYKGTVPVSFKKTTGTHYITIIQAGKSKTYTEKIENDGKDVTYNYDN